MKTTSSLFLIGLFTFLTFAAPQAVKVERVSKGLEVLYDFQSTKGNVVKDRSNTAQPLDLRITNLRAVRRAKGELEVRNKTLIRSEKPPTQLIDALKRSNELTIELWMRPTNTTLSGPARILTLSKNPNERNFTIGQDGDLFDVRLRTTKTSNNGIPSMSSPRRSLVTRMTHVVYTRNRAGQARLYLDGRRVIQRNVAGNLSRWDRSYRLGLANEFSGDRPWLGIYRLVAIYSRALTASEVEQNFQAGGGKKAPPVVRVDERQRFKKHIAPMLAKHCLECHGWKSTRGRLDLSKKSTAFKGKKNTTIIEPGNASDSLLWKVVQSNDMPRNRPPLSLKEKALLREWIDAGAVWSIDTLDRKTYATEKEPSSNWLRRLTVPEYIETVRSTVGVDIADDAHKILPRDLRADGFSNTAYNLNIDLGHVEAYSRLAKLIVDRMDIRKFAKRFTDKQEVTNANMSNLITKMGYWLLRGPLTEREIEPYQRIVQAVTKEGGNFEEAVSYVIEAMLQSPRFIYRMEKQRGDGQSAQVSDYELASRLSYILWGGPPDEELLRAAGAGELSNQARLKLQVQRMLKDPRVIEQSARFVSEWLDLDRLNNLRPNPKKFPKWNAKLADDMREETLAFFKEVVWKQKQPLSELLNAQVTFLTPRLAKHYGLQPQGKDFSRYDLNSNPSRGGLLTHGSILTVGGDEASMVSRGLFILHDLLGDEVGDPPPCVDTTPVPTKPGMSQRSIAMSRVANTACGGCHSRFEPLAYGLERFDGLGTYHEKDEHGNKLRDDGTILFPETDKAVPYKSSAEMMKLLACSERVQQTLTRKVIQFALGRPLIEADEPSIAKVYQQSKFNGGTYSSLLSAIVMSDLVRETRTEK